MTLPRCSGCGRPSGSHSSLHERHADDARPGLHRNADLQPGVAADLHVLFPFGIAGKAGLAVAGVTGRGGPALGAAADGEPLQQLAIETDVELLRPAHALEVILILPLQTNLDEVLAVDGKVMANRDAAARSERQIFALPIVLHHVQGDLERLDRRARRRQTCREPRHLAGDRQISFQVGRRNRERHPRSCRSCRRRSRPRAAATSTSRSSANRSRIALLYSVRFRRWTALILPGFGLAAHARSISVSSAARHRAIRRRIGPRPSGRRHRAGAKLRDDSLPHFGIGAGLREHPAVSSASPAVRSFWLWHVTQYWSSTARGDGEVAGAVCAAMPLPMKSAKTDSLRNSIRVRGHFA